MGKTGAAKTGKLLKDGDRAIRKRAASSGTVITPNQSSFLKHNMNTNQKRSNSISGIQDISQLVNFDETTVGVPEPYDKEKHMQSLHVNVVRNDRETQNAKSAWGKLATTRDHIEKALDPMVKNDEEEAKLPELFEHFIRSTRCSPGFESFEFSSASDIEYNSGSDGFSSDASTGSKVAEAVGAHQETVWLK